MLRALKDGIEVCMTVTLLDGIVLARSGFHHSMNYRSVAIFGRARLVDDPEEKIAALDDFMERLAPGRWREVREPSAKAHKTTTALAFPLEDAPAQHPARSEERRVGKRWGLTC